MDDFSISSLHESKNEWASRLITILTPLIIEGYKCIFDEALKLCKENNEMDKYLMTFQNFISRVPRWNASIIDQEKKRIVEKSCCAYLEDLITCVHIIQLKILTSMRVGSKQKKIVITIPKVEEFIHKTYINVARKLYKNVYLYELNISPLQIQKHNRELEIIVQECILNTIRESIPVESILKAYMDETVEEEVTEEIKEETIEDDPLPIATGGANEGDPLSDSSKISFNNVDFVRDENNNEVKIDAPKTLERLEELSDFRQKQKMLESDSDDDDDNSKLIISDQSVDLNMTDFQSVDNDDLNNDDLLINDVEILA